MPLIDLPQLSENKMNNLVTGMWKEHLWNEPEVVLDLPSERRVRVAVRIRIRVGAEPEILDMHLEWGSNWAGQVTAVFEDNQNS